MDRRELLKTGIAFTLTPIVGMQSSAADAQYAQALSLGWRGLSWLAAEWGSKLLVNFPAYYVEPYVKAGAKALIDYISGSKPGSNVVTNFHSQYDSALTFSNPTGKFQRSVGSHNLIVDAHPTLTQPKSRYDPRYHSLNHHELAKALIATDVKKRNRPKEKKVFVADGPREQPNPNHCEIFENFKSLYNIPNAILKYVRPVGFFDPGNPYDPQDPCECTTDRFLGLGYSVSPLNDGIDDFWLV